MVDGISDSDLSIIYITNAVASGLSILGCLFIIYMYLAFQELRRLAFKIIVILSIFDLLNAISFMIPTYESGVSDVICVTQGIIMNFTTFAAVLWTSFIALTLYVIVVKSFLDIEWLMNRFLIFDTIVSCILSAVPFIIEFKKNEGYCWLYKGTSLTKDELKFYTMLVPLWGCILFNLMLYLIVFRNLRGSEGGDVAIMRRKLSIKIGIYPIIIVICYLPYTVKGIMEIDGKLNKLNYEFNFTLIAGMIRCLIGLFNAIAYGLTKKVKKIIGKKMRGHRDSARSTLLTQYK